MPKPTDKNLPRRGRKAEGRTAKMIRMRPESWAVLDQRMRGRGDTRGRVIERMLAHPALPPETTPEKKNKMPTTTIDTSMYYVQLYGPDFYGDGELEPWGASATERVRVAAKNIGLDANEHEGWSKIDLSEGDRVEIDWAEHAWGTGRRYNVRQWETWLQRQMTY